MQNEQNPTAQPKPGVTRRFGDFPETQVSCGEDSTDLNPRQVGVQTSIEIDSAVSPRLGKVQSDAGFTRQARFLSGDRSFQWLLLAALLALGTTAMGAWMASGSDDQDRALAWQEARSEMIEQQVEKRGVSNSRVLAAMREVPRHRFVPEELRGQAYRDHPLPIGYDQTISQPYIVALMAELLEPRGDERILEIGTGSGYHAAVLSRVVSEVYSIEIIEELGHRAAQVLTTLGYDNIHSRIGDGYRGWPEAAPFDAILLTAAPARVPEPLLEQLKVGGRLVLPLGKDNQDLQVLTKTADGYERRVIAPVRFVPMTGEALEGAGG